MSEENKPVEEQTAETPVVAEASTITTFAPAPSVPVEVEAPLLTEEVQVLTNEEEEETLVKLRAKLYRLAKECEPAEWKERGTGELKLLQHKETQKIRVLMRRDKTLKICANHYVHPDMKLESNFSSDKSWMYKVQQDFSDGASEGEELLAVRFQNSEDATKWKDAFVEAQSEMKKIMEAAIAEGKNEA